MPKDKNGKHHAETTVSYRSRLRITPGGRGRIDDMHERSEILYRKFKTLGAASDLDEAIHLEQSALKLLPLGNPSRPSLLFNLANCLHSRFEQLGRISDLDEALAFHCDALQLRPQGHPNRAMSLNSLANCLQSRFKQLGRLSDLDQAVAFHRHALLLLPKWDSNRSCSLNNLAGCLRSRFEQHGRISDLDEALAFLRHALRLRPPGHPDRALSLNNLANCLQSRFEHLGRLSDLDEALAFHRDALKLFPQGHPLRSSSLNNLASCLQSRFKQLGRLSDLDEALAIHHDALKLRPQGHPLRSCSLNNLASCLWSRFKEIGDLSDLDEALAFHYGAFQLRPLGHPDRASSLNNLGSCLRSRFEQSGRLLDLDNALAFHRHALKLLPPGHHHPDRSFSLISVADCLHTRFKYLGENDAKVLQEMFDVYSLLSHHSYTLSHSDLGRIKMWIQAAERYKHSTTVLAYQTFLRLSVQHLAIVPGLPQQLDPLKMLMASIPVNAFSACLRHSNPLTAVELLEQGRGVFWTQLTRFRSPLDELITSGDAGERLGNKLKQTATMLRNLLSGSLSDDDSQHNQVCHLGIKMQDAISEIRRLPGFSRFLQPPLYSDLRAAAAGGPVIIVNASEYTCDALIITHDQRPIHIPLSITKARISKLSVDLRSLTRCAKFKDATKNLVIILRELWDLVVFPIVKILLMFCPRQSRIWWCPTAEFCLLPLHAAGRYRTGQPILSDLYISSYTPTLAALIRARREISLRMEKTRLLLVGQAEALGQGTLVSVNSELSRISQLVGPATALTCIQGQDANIAKVSEELNKHEFVHFACHGVRDREYPFESGFALADGVLMIEHIMQYDIRDGRFAYLSACHTTVGDEESLDEVIHIAAAMQFAGFRSVIGTMWSVKDAYVEAITSKFYEYMLDEDGRLDHTRAALALHGTMQSVPDIPIEQRILYIHIGA